MAKDKMWNGIGWYGFIGVITTSTTDISLGIHVLATFLSRLSPVSIWEKAGSIHHEWIHRQP